MVSLHEHLFELGMQEFDHFNVHGNLFFGDRPLLHVFNRFFHHAATRREKGHSLGVGREDIGVTVTTDRFQRSVGSDKIIELIKFGKPGRADHGRN